MGIGRYFGCMKARRKEFVQADLPPKPKSTLCGKRIKEILETVVDQQVIDFSKSSSSWSNETQLPVKKETLKDPNIVAAIKVCGV